MGWGGGSGGGVCYDPAFKYNVCSAFHNNIVVILLLLFFLLLHD